MQLSMKRTGARAAVAPLLASAILVLAGCASQGAGPSAAGTSSETTTAGAVAPPSAGASAEGATGAPTADWTVSAAGFGPLRLGRTWSELTSDPSVALTGSLEKCPTAVVAKPGYRFAVAFPGGEYGDASAVPTVQSVTVTATGSDTGGVTLLGADGVTIGSPSSSVAAAYPGGTWGTSSGRSGIDQIYVVDQGPITFGFANGAVAAIAVGARDVSEAACA